jgi:hypothetical protein
MPRPLSTSADDTGIRKARLCTYLARAASSYVRAAMTRGTPEGCAKQMFGGDPVTQIVMRAATSQAKTTGSGWADSLAAQTVDDFVLSIAVLSAGAALIAKGLRINFDHYASIRLASADVQSCQRWRMDRGRRADSRGRPQRDRL